MPAEIPIIVLSGVLNCVPAAEFTSFIPSELAKATPKHFSRDLTCRADQKSAALYSTESTFIRKKKKKTHHIIIPLYPRGHPEIALLLVITLVFS